MRVCVVEAGKYARQEKSRVVQSRTAAGRVGEWGAGGLGPGRPPGHPGVGRRWAAGAADWPCPGQEAGPETPLLREDSDLDPHHCGEALMVREKGENSESLGST